MSFTVAIDGPAAAGKGTISKSVAETFGLAHLDTGLLYRAVGAKVLLGADPIKAAQALSADDLAAENLRTPEVAQSASKVAVIPEVRAALLDFQRVFARRAGGAVLDGRDIGTVICPDAEVKLFVTASAECRAERRFRELSAKGHPDRYEQVLEDVRARDARDAGRIAAPMMRAQDAVVIDTSDMTVEQAVQQAYDVISARMS